MNSREEPPKDFFAARKIDDEAFEKERETLREINSRKSIFSRWKGYFKFTGPGWLQSALTLGAATSGSAIMAGSMFGYDLLWVVPLGKFFGIICLAAIGYQVCFTGERPYKVFWDKLHPALAVFWGVNVLLASVVWQFPQYALGTDVVKDMFLVVNVDMPRWIIAFVFLILATAMCWSYGLGKRKSVVLFEQMLKYMVWMLVFALLLVVIKTGLDWGETLKGFFYFRIPHDIEGIMIILGLLGASIGVNTTFLYPYAILARRWIKEHSKLKDFDLVSSMFIPSVIAPSLLLIAVANTLNVKGIEVKGAIDVAHTLAPLVGLTTARIIFSLGILGMCVSTMILEMLICGFVLAEMIGFDPRGWKFRLTTSIANVGIIGAFAAIPFWVPVATSAFNLIMTPIAFICFFILQNRRDYLGENVNRGWKGYLWNFGMLIAIFINALGTAGYIVGRLM
ncbi:MAG: divalent metal cation transporter [bacterium]